MGMSWEKNIYMQIQETLDELRHTLKVRGWMIVAALALQPVFFAVGLYLGRHGY